ncbi:MAG: hypothetical protein WC421_10550 [Elusimicrobiales bacterium]
MKKYATTLLALCTLASLAAAERIIDKAEYPPEVVVVHLGPKPAALDEGRYPDVKFYYVPAVAIEKVPKTVPPDYKMTGAPEALVTWYNAGEQMANRGMLFDKKGIAAFDGYIDRQEIIVETISRKTKDPLKDALKDLVKKGKDAESDDRAFEPDSRKGLVGIKMPEFDVTDSTGQARPIRTVITDAAKPVLVVFAYFPADTKFDMAAESKADADNAKSVGGFFGGMAKMALKSKVGETSDKLTGQDNKVTYPKLLNSIELQFFGKDVTKPK